ncbi:MAG: restriction endonuclease [Hyphomicrobiales bacterium]|nr:MAG: restriction endonuclease [Hyphomicrobiales bacterium]
MNDHPDDLHRLIHDTLQELGWNADASEIAERVKRLDIGLPAEDEFAVLCSWLGKCELLHKLDQHQLPATSGKDYQVPDVLAYFSTQVERRPVLIEVKSKAANTLSFKPDYLARLNNYADLVGLPLLVAWKFHSLWMLFEVRHLTKAVRNFNINFGDAMKENLLGILAGDVAYKIGPGAGIHLRFQKEELLSVTETDDTKTENWRMRITEVAFTGRGGEQVSDLSSDVQSLFTTWDLERREAHADDHIWVSHVAGGDGIQFAHTALVRLPDWRLPTGTKVSWRREARKEKLSTIADFRGAVTKALEEKIVQYVFDIAPHTVPDFLVRS